ncbi:Isochorismatase-like protein [Mycena vitilis]|nr:Isochorismatase-like protein [Mycena vitilis]
MSAKSYRELWGIPPSTASTEDSILLIIDGQNELERGLLAISDLQSTRPVIKQLLERYRASQGHIVHAWHTTPAGAPVFTPGTPLEEVFPELTPKDGEVILKKKFPNAFAETNLQQIITETGLNKIVVVGYMAHLCVSTTARAAHQRGYEVLLVEDAIGDRDIPGVSAEELTKVVLAELGDAFATVIKSGEVH